MSINPESYEQPSIPPALYAEAVEILKAVADGCVCTGPHPHYTCLTLARADPKWRHLCPKCRAEKFLSEHP